MSEKTATERFREFAEQKAKKVEPFTAAHFKKWFVDILNDLFKKPDTGFVIMMITFPLLERYLREKSKFLGKSIPKDSKYYDMLLFLFPEFKTKEHAKLDSQKFYKIIVRYNNKINIKIP